LILVVAVLIGVVAAFGLYQYVQKVEEDAKPNPVTVYMVKNPIPRGTSFESAQASIVEETIPAEFRPETYVADLKSLENKVAITDLPANSVLVQGMFVGADVATTSFRDRLTGDNVAIALPIDGVRAVGGLLQPGDEVNSLVTLKSGGEETAKAPGTPPAGASTVIPNQSPYTSASRYMYEKVRILAIGNSVRPVAGEPVDDKTASANSTATTGSVIVEVPAEVAQRLAAVDPANFYLTLVPENWNPRAIGTLTPEDLSGVLPAEDANRLTPYGPKGYAPVAGKGN
jgi:pilus assembly protein CpaB